MTTATAPDPARTQARLAAIMRYRTAYELVLSRGDERYLVCYCRSSKSRAGIDRAVTQPARAAALVAFTGSESITYGKRVADGATIGEWTVNWSGRTERDAILGGELVHFTLVA